MLSHRNLDQQEVPRKVNDFVNQEERLVFLGRTSPNIIPQLCMYIQHGVSSTGQQLKTRKTKLLFLGCTSPNNHIVIFIQQNGQHFTTHFAITNNMQLKHFHFPNRGRLFKSITNLLDLRCVMLYTILRL